jgi:hypothetical protein
MTFSLYSALETAIVDSGRQFEHQATVMEQVRLVVELAAPNRYEHRLMGYNNDPEVTFADIKRMLRLAELMETRRDASSRTACERRKRRVAGGVRGRRRAADHHTMRTA